MSQVTLANGAAFSAESGTSLLDAALAQGFVLEHGCRTGRCGSCKARVVKGTTAPLRASPSLTDAEAAQGWVPTCSSEAVTDVQLDVEDLGRLAEYPPRVTPSRIDGLERVADDVVRVVLRLPATSPFRFLAGQHVDVTSPTGARRSYSIASVAAAPGRVELHIRRESLSGYLMLAQRLWTDGTAFAEGWNLGPPDEDARSVQWIVERLVRQWGGNAGWQPDGSAHPHEAKYLKLDVSQARARLGWQPRWRLAEALEHIVAWHRAWLAGEDVRALCLRQIGQFTAAAIAS